MDVKYKKGYFDFCRIILFTYLFCTLACGRVFSILNIQIGSFPVFVTEILLFLCFPLIVLNIMDACKRLPRYFIFVLSIFFLYGCVYLYRGIINLNLFALRDIVLCVYILFLPLTLIMFVGFKEMKLFIYILVAGNIIGLLLGRFVLFSMYNIYNFRGLHGFPYVFALALGHVRFFNLGLFYGMTVAFIIAMYPLLKLRSHLAYALLCLTFNFYMFIFMGVRSLWIAVLFLILFLAINLKMKFIRFTVYFIPAFLITASILFYFDFISTNALTNRVFEKFGSLNFFVKNVIISKKISPSFPFTEKYDSKEPSLISSKRNDQVTNNLKRNDQVTNNLQSVNKVSSTKSKTKPIFNLGDLNSYRTDLDNINWRLVVWRDSIEFGMNSFWFGRGFGVYPQYKIWNYTKPVALGYKSEIIPAHNHLITVFYKMGFCGLTLFVLINIFVFIYGLRNLKKCKTVFSRSFLVAALGVFLYWHTLAFFFDVIDSPSSSIFLWIIIGLIFKIIELESLNLAEPNELRGK